MIKISHIVVLAKNHSKELYHYQCMSVDDIQDSMPIKIFINGFDFTRKLTSRTRLDKKSLRYIIENIFRSTFKRIRRYFDTLKVDSKLKRLTTTVGRKPQRLQRMEDCPLLKPLDSSSPQKKRKIEIKKPITFVKSTEKIDNSELQDKTTNVVSYQKQSLDYTSLTNMMLKAGLRKQFDRVFLIYLQSICESISATATADGYSGFSLYLDHSVFSFLIQHGIATSAEFERLVESILAECEVPSQASLTSMFRVLLIQKKIVLSTSGRPLETTLLAEYFYEAIVSRVNNSKVLTNNKTGDTTTTPSSDNKIKRSDKPPVPSSLATVGASRKRRR